MSILIYCSDPEPYREALMKAGVLEDMKVARTPEEARDEVADAEILFAWRFPRDLYARAPRLRWVQSMGAGVEDIVQAQGLGPDTAVTRVSDQFGGLIAEYVFGELLYRVRNIGRCRDLQAHKAWDPFLPDTLAGKLIGVAGLGAIGREIVRKARAFDMRVFGLSRTGEAAGLVDRAFGPEDWIGFVRELDVLVLAMPLTDRTRHAVGERVLGAMRPTSLLVNVGRGALVDEDRLVEALRAGRPGGAILDVFETEPLPPESPLWTLPNVTVSPHMSGPSMAEGAAAFFRENLRRFRAGEPLEGLVDLRRQY